MPAPRVADRPERLRRGGLERDLGAERAVGGRGQPAGGGARLHPRPLEDHPAPDAARGVKPERRGNDGTSPSLPLRGEGQGGGSMKGPALSGRPPAARTSGPGQKTSVTPSRM